MNGGRNRRGTERGTRYNKAIPESPKAYAERDKVQGAPHRKRQVDGDEKHDQSHQQGDQCVLLIQGRPLQESGTNRPSPYSAALGASEIAP